VVVQVVIKGWEEQMGNRSENWQDFAGREWVRKAASVSWSKEIHIITVSTIKILRYKIPQDMM